MHYQIYINASLNIKLKNTAIKIMNMWAGRPLTPLLFTIYYLNINVYLHQIINTKIMCTNIRTTDSGYAIA